MKILVRIAMLALGWYTWISCDVAARAQSRGKHVEEYTRAAFCELVRNPKEYDGKYVVVHASYRYGYEWQEVLGMNCRGQARTWLEFDDDTKSNVRHAFAKAPRHLGIVNATFYGVFQGSRGPYGDGSYAYELVVRSVKNIEVVSKTGVVPEQLSPAEQRKLSRGDEVAEQ
jgi:hypothetical protein